MTEKSDPPSGTGGIPHPGAALAQAMKAKGLSANRLALGLRVPSGRITSIMNGKRGITAETALRLARFFSTSEEYWMDLQSRYELAEARARHGRQIDEEVPAGGALDAGAVEDSTGDLNSREGLVTGLARLGFMYANRGSFAEAESHYKMLLDANKHLYDEAGRATDHANLGSLYAQQGKHRDARREWKQALALYDKSGEKENAAVVKEWLSNLDSRRNA
ncbi:MAG: HigA family addiction module antitoxin [Arenicellales bacterium]